MLFQKNSISIEDIKRLDRAKNSARNFFPKSNFMMGVMKVSRNDPTTVEYYFYTFYEHENDQTKVQIKKLNLFIFDKYLKEADKLN